MKENTMADECAPPDHRYSEPSKWEHHVGTDSSYRVRIRTLCGHPEIEGRGIWDDRDGDMPADEVLVVGGRLDGLQTLADALAELAP
jgi:hypothetical protein